MKRFKSTVLFISVILLGSGCGKNLAPQGVGTTPLLASISHTDEKPEEASTTHVDPFGNVTVLATPGRRLIGKVTAEFLDRLQKRVATAPDTVALVDKGDCELPFVAVTTFEAKIYPDGKTPLVIGRLEIDEDERSCRRLPAAKEKKKLRQVSEELLQLAVLAEDMRSSVLELPR